jgi:diacylglycerol kinase (ATP)
MQQPRQAVPPADAIDRIGPEWHALSGRAKDMGSAAVLLSLLLCAGIWLAVLYGRLVA